MKRNNGIGIATVFIASLILSLMALVALSGCAYWDQALIAVDDAIQGLPAEKPAEPSPDPEPVPDKPAEPDPKPAPDPEPECGVPALPGQATIERLAALWKPVSESDGRLVALVGRGVRTYVISAEVQLRGETLASGRFVGDTHNGCRPHHRFPAAGAAYPSGSVLLYKIRGEGGTWLVSYYIGDSAARIEWRGPTGIISPDGRIIRK